MAVQLQGGRIEEMAEPAGAAWVFHQHAGLVMKQAEAEEVREPMYASTLGGRGMVR